MKRLIRIETIYGENIMGIEIKKNKIGIFLDKGFVYFCDIKYVDIIGDIIDN